MIETIIFRLICRLYKYYVTMKWLFSSGCTDPGDRWCDFGGGVYDCAEDCDGKHECDDGGDESEATC